LLKRIEKEFTGDPDILFLLSCEERFCTYADLCTTLSVEDFYDLLEMAHVNAALRADAHKRQQQS
jgi:hypothetical protein